MTRSTSAVTRVTRNTFSAALAATGLCLLMGAFAAPALAQGRNPGHSDGGGRSSGDSGRSSGDSGRSSGHSESRPAPRVETHSESRSAPRYEPRNESRPAPRVEYRPSSGGGDVRPAPRLDSRGNSDVRPAPRLDYRPSDGGSSYRTQRDQGSTFHYYGSDRPNRDNRDSGSGSRNDTSARRYDGGSRQSGGSARSDGGYYLDRRNDNRPARDGGRDSGSGSYLNRGGSDRGSSARQDARNSRIYRDNNWRDSSRGSIGSSRVSPDRDHGSAIFGKTAEGRAYRNGINLRGSYYTKYPEIRRYYGGSVYYPYYAPTFGVGVYYSPYSFYFGVAAPYIYREHCFYYPPSVVYVDVPVYVDGSYRSYDRYDDNYYLNDGPDYYRPENVPDPDLRAAIDNIRDTFRSGDIEPLVALTDPNVRIAVFLKGKYDYSLNPNDYLDMTRDALHAMDTITFDLTRVHRRAYNVYVVSGKHVYQDRDGQRRTVYVSFVLEKVNDRWTLTQVGTAPDRIQEP